VLTGEQLDQLKRLPGPLVEQTLDRAAGTIAGRPIADAAKLTTNEFRRLVRGYLDRAPEETPAQRDPILVLAQKVKMLSDADRAELFRKLTVLRATDGTPWTLRKA
jgi:hypothetical protein